MLRSLFRRKRTIRVPIEESGRNVREVKIFKKPFSKPSTFINTFILGYIVSHAYEAYATNPGDKAQSSRTLDTAKKGNANDSESQGLSDHWKKQHESIRKNGDIVPVFSADGLPPDVISTITLPVWIRAKKSQLYTSDDPEAKDFVRIQADAKKIDSLKRQVGQWAGTRLRNPAHKINLDYIGFSGQIAVSLHLVPQLHPPPLYEVPAIVIFKDGIGLGWKVLRPDLGSRMEAVFRPSVTYAAAKASLNVFFLTSYALMKAKLTGSQSMVINMRAAKPSSTVMSAKDIDKDNSMPSMSNLPAGMSAATLQELMKVLHNGANTRERHSDLIKQLPLSTAVQMASATFRQKQLLGIAQAQQLRARGVLQVRGHIICVGKRGQYQLDVIAFYLPAEDKFLGPLVLSNAYVVKDYNEWQKIEDDVKKKLNDRKKDSRPKPDTHVSSEKSPPGDEKEEGTK